MGIKRIGSGFFGQVDRADRVLLVELVRMWATFDMDVIFRARSSWLYGFVGITARMSPSKSKSRLRVRDREREMREKPGSSEREKGSNSSTVRREEERRQRQ